MSSSKNYMISCVGMIFFSYDEIVTDWNAGYVKPEHASQTRFHPSKLDRWEFVLGHFLAGPLIVLLLFRLLLIMWKCETSANQAHWCGCFFKTFSLPTINNLSPIRSITGCIFLHQGSNSEQHRLHVLKLNNLSRLKTHVYHCICLAERYREDWFSHSRLCEGNKKLRTNILASEDVAGSDTGKGVWCLRASRVPRGAKWHVLLLGPCPL